MSGPAADAMSEQGNSIRDTEGCRIVIRGTDPRATLLEFPYLGV